MDFFSAIILVFSLINAEMSRRRSDLTAAMGWALVFIGSLGRLFGV